MSFITARKWFISIALAVSLIGGTGYILVVFYRSGFKDIEHILATLFSGLGISVAVFVASWFAYMGVWIVVWILYFLATVIIGKIKNT